MKRKKTILRDQAFSATVTAGRGPIVALQEVDGSLEAFQTDGISSICSPNAIDPQKHNPDLPFEQRIVRSSCGAEDFVVARIYIQQFEMLKTIGAERESVLELLSVLRSVRESLIAGYLTAVDLNIDIYNITKRIESDGLKGKHIANLPRVDNLEDRVSHFLSSIKQALQHSANVFNVALDVNLTGPHFHKILELCNREFGEKHPLTLVVSDAHEFFKYLVSMRNAIEHPGLEQSLLVKDFCLGQNGNINMPTWQLSHIKREGIAGATNRIVSFVVEYLELMFLFLFLERYDSFQEIARTEILFISEEDQDPKCPIHYKVRLLPHSNYTTSNGK